MHLIHRGIVNKLFKENLLEFNKDLFKEFDKKFPKIVLYKPEISTFENMLEFKSINKVF